MGPAITSLLANGYEVFNDEEEAPTMSIDEAKYESSNLVVKAREYVASHQYEAAALAFYQAAEIRKIYQLKSENVIQTYDSSANWFLKVKDIRAVICFQNVIELYLEKDNIKLAIKHCFQYGYLCEQVLQDKTHSNNLYDWADEFRHKHGYQHICPLIKFKRNITNKGDNTNLSIKNFIVYKWDGCRHVIDYMCKQIYNA
ncbi:hypothetical protein RF11_11607 [Thelohanellus kitauei]|uniref:Uncharacterized protein n=1 Tax=Thelohanellus kitauei TaxID=669202 RepID=A0A0C2J9W4_THEKT|nr:hypothetical protein RF11_11607 [Thelohanellus kitauei]